MMKSKFMKASLNKCRKMGSIAMQSSTESSSSSSSSSSSCCTQLCLCCIWATSKSSNQEAAEKFIPNDVPKGHVAVYIGPEYKRFVIKIRLLNHPLFRALLDQVRDQFDDSSTPPKFWIPCPESVFLHVLRCAR